MINKIFDTKQINPGGECIMAQKREKNKQKIDRIEITKDKLTDRGGLALFVHYLTAVGIYPMLERLFGSIRKSKKGQEVENIFKQLLCFFVDGTSFALSRFDDLREDEGYREVMENREEEMCSSHAVKRFFQAFSYVRIWLFRHLLQELFIWRLKIEQPKVIILGADTMVMDNDDAEKREGVQPTYKNKKGFQPLQLTWRQYMADAVFRGGKKNSNHGDTVMKMVKHIVAKIRKRYSKAVPILLRQDSGFFDQKNFEEYEKLRIGYIAGGKLYEDIKEYVGSVPGESFGRYENGEQAWDYVEFGDCRGTWDKFRRAIFCRPLYEDKQMLMEFARPDTIIYTNIGVDEEITNSLVEAGYGDYLQPQGLIETFHGRGADELVNRALKDFGTEKMPFKKFTPNAAFYYVMLVAFFLYEAFKEDVAFPVVKVSSYATTVRRTVLDVAAKIVHTSGQIILKVTEATWKRIKIEELWQRCNAPPTLIPVRVA